MKPMLAKRWQDQRHKLKFPLCVQPKLNGVRALFTRGFFQSRDEVLWNAPVLSHLASALADLPSEWILDGELYVHGWSLQTINSAISVARKEPSEKTTLVSYWVFDCINVRATHLPFNERFDAFQLFHSLHFSPHSPIKVTPTHFVKDEIEAARWFDYYKNKQFEGLMYRALSHPYGFSADCTNQENRWPILLKRKDFIDEEFTCIDIEEGTGKYTNMVGSLVFDNPYGPRFCAGSGLTDHQRQAFFLSPPIGRQFTITYEMLSDSGTPLKPTISTK